MNYGDRPSAVLHWNYRGFTEFPLKLLNGEESEITDIYLKENLISRIPSDIGRLEHLESLYLSGNDITHLPREISKLRWLKCLDVSGNRLRYIPDEIGEVRSLKFLILDENELCELPARIGELRALRYLSVCDNNIQWLPQRPVYNYHHCEFRFWRNCLKAIPYSLWHNMFKEQQTRSLSLGKSPNHNKENELPDRHFFQIQILQENGSQEVIVNCPPQHQNVFGRQKISPPSLYELCRRKFYQIISDISSKKVATSSYSIFSDFPKDDIDNIDFESVNISNGRVINEDKNGNNYEFKLIPTVLRIDKSKTKERSYYVPSDIVEEYYNFLPGFMKGDLCSGPVSRCENVSCKRPIFDFVLYEFCLGKIKLIENTEDIILSAVFCSKTCSEIWKKGKTNILPWTLSRSKS